MNPRLFRSADAAMTIGEQHFPSNNGALHLTIIDTRICNHYCRNGWVGLWYVRKVEVSAVPSGPALTCAGIATLTWPFIHLRKAIKTLSGEMSVRVSDMGG